MDKQGWWNFPTLSPESEATQQRDLSTSSVLSNFLFRAMQQEEKKTTIF